MVPRKGPVSAAAVIVLLLPLAGMTAEAPPATSSEALPADFLEYLATLEGEDDDWTDFAGSDPAPVAKSPKKAADGAANEERPK